jgi:hypothetical protein
MIGELRIMDKEAGDLPISWDSDDEDQVEIAKAAFDKAKSKGMIMYKTDKKGNKGEVITKFDKNAERIIAAPALVGG